jgi:hypothetical protein
MNDIKAKLLNLSIGSCSCMTKTPVIYYHDENCRYRILQEISQEVDHILELNKNLTNQLKERDTNDQK